MSCPFCSQFLVDFYDGCHALCLGGDNHHHDHDYLPWESEDWICQVNAAFVHC